MRPQVGVGKLKHAPPMQASDLPLVSQAVWPASRIFHSSPHARGSDRVGVSSKCVSTSTQARTHRFLLQRRRILRRISAYYVGKMGTGSNFRQFPENAKLDAAEIRAWTRFSRRP